MVPAKSQLVQRKFLEKNYMVSAVNGCGNYFVFNYTLFSAEDSVVDIINGYLGREKEEEKDKAASIN